MGPLQGVKVVEMAGIGPISYAGMMLADLGAEVTRIERPSEGGFAWGASPVLDRGRDARRVDLKTPAGVEEVLGLIGASEVLIEGFRPGVMERLGLGPDECLARNPALVYGRMTGWGQDGRYAHTAGHDITYLAISGVLHMVGEPDRKPVPPVNLVGDFGGGGAYLAFGVFARSCTRARAASARSSTRRSSTAPPRSPACSTASSSMAPGVTSAASTCSTAARPSTTPTAAPTVAGSRSARSSRSSTRRCWRRWGWPATRRSPTTSTRRPGPRSAMRFEAKFAERSRDEWHELFADSDCCVAPVLSMREAREDGHNRDRGVFVEVGGMPQPAPAPRFSVTEPDVPAPPPRPSPRTPGAP